MPEVRTNCVECGAPLFEDPDHDAFDEAIHLCVLDEWIWFDYEPQQGMTDLEKAPWPTSHNHLTS
ncbi:MAG TPA: hypothetical protein VF660_11560 [Actinomycetota bacterium]|jgi:hypothetical protein